MSAHYGAPGFRRPQLATPSFTASPQGTDLPARSGGAPVLRRKALFVAAATLCAPALAALALAAVAATGGGSQAAMGSLAGTQGLRGNASPPLSASPAARDSKDWTAAKKGDSSDWPPTHRVQTQKHPAAKAPATPAPVHHPAPAPPRAPKPTHVRPPSLPTSDPTGPGAPIPSTGGTSGSSSSGTDTGSGSSGSGSGSSGYGGPGGSSDGYNASSGGG
jgi:uncharacterized membrane protein YgcG